MVVINFFKSVVNFLSAPQYLVTAMLVLLLIGLRSKWLWSKKKLAWLESLDLHPIAKLRLELAVEEFKSLKMKNKRLEAELAERKPKPKKRMDWITGTRSPDAPDIAGTQPFATKAGVQASGNPRRPSSRSRAQNGFQVGRSVNFR